MNKKFSFLSSLLENGVDLKNAGKTDAGKNDVINKSDDVTFELARNRINTNQEVTGALVSDFINKAEELNNEVDTIVFGVETDDDYVIKVYVAAEQAEKFEAALSAKLGIDDDVETVLNELAVDFDIVDIVWPKSKEGEENDVDGVEVDDIGDGQDNTTSDLDAEISSALAQDDDDDDAFTDTDDYEVVSAIPPLMKDGEPDSNEGDSQETETTGVDAEKDKTTDSNDVEIDDEELPEPDDNGEESTPWMRLNDLIMTVFKDEEQVTGVQGLTYEQLSKVINIEKADEIAISQYGASDFATLEEDEKEEIINANPDLILTKDDDKESDTDTPVEDETTTDDEKSTTGKGNKEEEPKQESISKFSFLASL